VCVSFIFYMFVFFLLWFQGEKVGRGAKAGLAQDAPGGRCATLSRLGGLGSVQAPAVVRAEPGHLTKFGAFWFANPAFCEVNHSSETVETYAEKQAFCTPHFKHAGPGQFLHHTSSRHQLKVGFALKSSQRFSNCLGQDVSRVCVSLYCLSSNKTRNRCNLN